MADEMRGTSSKKTIIGALIIGTVVGVIGVAVTTEMVHVTSTNKFCATACHSMQWVADAYQRGPHHASRTGVTAGCGDCHIPYESRHADAFQYLALLTHKARAGTHDAITEAKGTISSRELWEKERPRLSSSVKEFMTGNNSLTCRGCHDLTKMDAKKNAAVAEMHAGVLKQDKIVCIECHEGVGHVYEPAGAQPAAPKSGATETSDKSAAVK